jgi:Spy/CpxP family protein refolding chaperone
MTDDQMAQLQGFTEQMNALKAQRETLGEARTEIRQDGVRVIHDEDGEYRALLKAEMDVARAMANAMGAAGAAA